MPRRKKRIKKPSRRKRSKISFQGLFIGLLFSIILIETFLLVRIHFNKQTPFGPPRKEVSVPKKPPKREKTSLGKIAIIIDDSGYSAKDCGYLADIKYPLTVAILPDLKYSKQVARCAHSQRKDVMLHLPLEPHVNREKYPEDYIIKTNMPAALVVKKFTASLASVPYTIGFNNHMGSKATENARFMSILFGEANKNDLFFIDSRVTSKTICREIAEKKKVAFAERDVFLDNKNERQYIENQFHLLVQKAKKQGFAIGIGHARKLTWKIVREQTEKLAKEGFEIVTVQTIVDDF